MGGKQTRRDFLKAGAALGLSYTLGGCRLSTSGDADNNKQADVIIINGCLSTQDERRSFASAAAIKDGRFIAVGTDKDILTYRGATTELIDVGGKTVIPGLIAVTCGP
jgi:adenine deaminase